MKSRKKNKMSMSVAGLVATGEVLTSGPPGRSHAARGREGPAVVRGHVVCEEITALWVKLRLVWVQEVVSRVGQEGRPLLNLGKRKGI